VRRPTCSSAPSILSVLIRHVEITPPQREDLAAPSSGECSDGFDRKHWRTLESLEQRARCVLRLGAGLRRRPICVSALALLGVQTINSNAVEQFHVQVAVEPMPNEP
jgi:hypothetical protein